MQYNKRKILKLFRNRRCRKAARRMLAGVNVQWSVRSAEEAFDLKMQVLENAKCMHYFADSVIRWAVAGPEAQRKAQ